MRGARTIASAMRSQHPELASPLKRCLGALATVSWPWVPACGSLEPPQRDGENAQKTGKNGGKMGKIRSKTRKGVGITCVVRDDSAGAKAAPAIAAAAHPETGAAAVVAARLRVVDRTEAALGES